MSLSAHERHLQFHVDEDFKLKHLMQDRILLRPLKDPSSKIIRIESQHNKPTRGLVIAVGPGKIDGKGRRHPLDVKPGDTIMFGQHAVVEIFFGNEKLLITREENVFGVCDEEETQAA
jgi:chaperonin GroES